MKFRIKTDSKKRFGETVETGRREREFLGFLQGKGDIIIRGRFKVEDEKFPSKQNKDRFLVLEVIFGELGDFDGDDGLGVGLGEEEVSLFEGGA